MSSLGLHYWPVSTARHKNQTSLKPLVTYTFSTTKFISSRNFFSYYYG